MVRNLRVSVLGSERTLMRGFVCGCQEIDFGRFEQLFKLSSAASHDEHDGSPTLGRTFKRKPEAVSLLEPQRLRNVGKYSLE